MRRWKLLSTGAAAVAGVWLVAAAGMWLARSQRMTAEKTMDYIETHRLAGRPADQRRQIVEDLADRVNHLSFEERQKFRFEHGIREFFESMNEEERAHYIDLTLPKGMQQMMQAFNEMTPAKRKQVVSRALAEMNRVQEEVGNQEFQKSISDENMQRIVNEGMKNYLRDANAATKIDLQPLIEQMQALMQSPR